MVSRRRYDVSAATRAAVPRILPGEVRMAEPVGGLIAFEQADLKERCLAGLTWARRLLQGKGGDTVGTRPVSSTI